jgi:alanine dehydrogenase
MIIGLPGEIKDGERRVALTPDAIALLVTAGLQIHGGQIMHPTIAHGLGQPHRDLDAVLFAC